MEDENNIKRCWMCRRTEEESLTDFKKIILEGNTESRMFGPIIPQNIKDIIKDEDIFPYPQGLEWEQSNIITFEKGWNQKTIGDVKFETDHKMFIDIYLCDVCQSIFNTQWESLKEFMFDRLEEKGINLAIM